jgi:thiamine pyrophosphate-dependent acetolactate synthase large subunit-like protein
MSARDELTCDPVMTVGEAMSLAYEVFDATPSPATSGDTAFLCANGYGSRDALAASDRPGNFYMLGSMGLGGSIALGAALAQPTRRVAVLDGDGNLLMGLGALTVIGTWQPANLYHLCFDNGVYASTGNQPTVAPHVCLERIAMAAGYGDCRSVETPRALQVALAEQLAEPGPSFLRIMVRSEEHPRPSFPRVKYPCPEIRDRFSGVLKG